MANIHLNSYKTPNDFQYNQIKTWFVLTFHFEVPVTFASVAVVVSQSKTNFRLAQWKLNTVQDVGAETRSGVVQTGHSFQTTKHKHIQTIQTGKFLCTGASTYNIQRDLTAKLMNCSQFSWI